MANLGVESRSSATDLLDAWSESGLDILSNDPEQSMNRSIGLSVDSGLVKRNSNAPPSFLYYQQEPPKRICIGGLRELKLSMIPSAIATLSQAALLVENKKENSLSGSFVVPVVQSL